MPEIPRQELLDFWECLEAYRDEVDAEVREAAAKLPEFANVLENMSEEALDAQSRESREIQRRALLEGQWEPYREYLASEGARYARQGIPFERWFDVVGVYRQSLLRRILSRYDEQPERRDSAVRGMSHVVDFAMSTIGSSYIDTKQDIIRHQQEAIRELSTPILQLRPRLLLVPLIGMVDTLRARQLTASLLAVVRERRAKVVILDVTGVPIVDSRVAAHLVETCDAARLMGAVVLMSGLSSAIAQTLVAIGAELPDVLTLTDLEDAVAEADRILADLAPR